MRLNFSVLSTAVLAIAAAFGLCSCVGYESSESSPNGYREETWYKGAGFFYLDRIMFDKEGEESAFSTKKKNNTSSNGGARIFRETKNN